MCVCVNAAGQKSLLTETLAGGSGVCPLLENVMSDGPFPPGLFDTGLHSAVVKCFRHQPVAWVDKDQGRPP